MKFNVEIDIDWLEEDDLDEIFKQKLLNKLSEQILKEFNEETGKLIAYNASALIRAKTELLINSVLEKPVVISDAWNSKEKYASIFDMVEQKMTALYEGKLNISGQCKKDPLLQNIENYIKQETERLLKIVETKIKKDAAIAAKQAVNESELIKAIGLAIK